MENESQPGKVPDAIAALVEDEEKSGGGKVSKSYASLVNLLETPSLRTRVIGLAALEFNEMSTSPTIGRRPLDDADLGMIRQKAEEIFRVRFSAADVQQAVCQVAHGHPFHPVREYLENLSQKGLPGGAIGKVCAILALENEMHQRMLRKFAISAVARVMRPGSKCDTVLVLVGPQGLYKSTFFTVLAGPGWSADTFMDVENKDSRMQLQLVWIYEWQELTAMQKARSLEGLKAFISACEDTYRPPYWKFAMTFKRTSVIVGTTNVKDFLTDSTGNRRYWPIPIGKRIDIAAVTELRDFFWAEAVAAYMAGETWWFTAEEDAKLGEMQEDYEQEDAWTEAVLAWIYAHPLPPPTTGEVIAGSLLKDRGQWTRADEMRVAAILRGDGWLHTRERRGSRRPWVWSRPLATPEQLVAIGKSPKGGEPAGGGAPKALVVNAATAVIPAVTTNDKLVTTTAAVTVTTKPNDKPAPNQEDPHGQD